MTILVVVSHPDDEVLGCGATVAAMVEQGHKAYSCILSASADARRYRPEVAELMEDMKRAHELLGITPYSLGGFPNIKLNTVPHLELVQFIERAIEETGATTLFTHHPQDLNNDHKHTSAACLAAARLFQRRNDVPPLQGLYFMEVLSSTDWSFPGVGSPFQADTFFEIGEHGLERKIDALSAYRRVMRDYPHSRSRETITSLATLRGSQAGVKYAEAFQTAFRRMDAISG